MGSLIHGGGVNFALYSSTAEKINLALFAGREDTKPSYEIELDNARHRTGSIWHVHIEGLNEGELYGYRVFGKRSIKDGLRFDPRKILLDPYAKAVVDLHGLPKSVVISDEFDWGDVPRPEIPLNEMVIYETHLRGLTIHPSARVQHPGTYKGVIDKIPYFKDLGITSLEFLPIQEFNHRELNRINPETGELLSNYWGYSTIAFFAPKDSYSSKDDTGGQVIEFKEMVRELHRAGIEVILDIVFNHTAEMNHRGPLYNFRGIDNPSYYILRQNKREYRNITGCGNTFNCNNPAAADLIIDCLRYWVGEMGVDGFRFDLATVFYRDEKGEWWENAPLTARIANDPLLSKIKLISEPWDAKGGYRVGNFGGSRWYDWNDRFRDDIRRFWKGDINTVGALATRLSGSSDLFWRKKNPLNSINFITCHDGFTLWDLNCYNEKRNLGNGHKNTDGASLNHSYNFGIEGETEDDDINRLRLRQAKNMFAALMLSQGIPMILGGDEFLRTQKGNNNAYCQDNEISWYEWDLLDKNRGFHRFCKEITAFRKRHPALRRTEFFNGADSDKSAPDISWFAPDGEPEDWKPENRTLACLIDGFESERWADEPDCDIYIAFNSDIKEVELTLPKAPNGNNWRMTVNTGADYPDDIMPPGGEKVLDRDAKLIMPPRSLIVLISR
ncbi:glycogen-debranching protein [bacterium]|nr:glycogen-debranching protein [FCB group bacterium]MBL7192120.1 glycogen-debranching protein [bacterium]